MERITAVAMFVSLMLVGSVAGIFLSTQLGQVRVQNRLGARDFTVVKHHFELAAGRLGGAPRSLALRSDTSDAAVACGIRGPGRRRCAA